MSGFFHPTFPWSKIVTQNHEFIKHDSSLLHFFLKFHPYILAFRRNEISRRPQRCFRWPCFKFWIALLGYYICFHLVLCIILNHIFSYLLSVHVAYELTYGMCVEVRGQIEEVTSLHSVGTRDELGHQTHCQCLIGTLCFLTEVSLHI